jgi:hypothetical protein
VNIGSSPDSRSDKIVPAVLTVAKMFQNVIAQNRPVVIFRARFESRGGKI